MPLVVKEYAESMVEFDAVAIAVAVALAVAPALAVAADGAVVRGPNAPENGSRDGRLTPGRTEPNAADLAV
jgi:hypothetical protein